MSLDEINPIAPATEARVSSSGFWQKKNNRKSALEHLIYRFPTYSGPAAIALGLA
jgi:hypothetical protein